MIVTGDMSDRGPDFYQILTVEEARVAVTAGGRQVRLSLGNQSRSEHRARPPEEDRYHSQFEKEVPNYCAMGWDRTGTRTATAR